MSAIDIVNANGQDYDIMSPEVVSDYVEKLGTICKNPNGYTKGSLFLARDAQGVERMYKATANITSNQTITVGSNCEHKKLGDLFNDVDSEVGNVKQALSDEVVTRASLGAHNLAPITLKSAIDNASSSGSWSGNVYTVAGMTFTFNSSENGYVDSVVVGGTPTGSNNKFFKMLGGLKLPAGTYILSGCPSGGTAGYTLYVGDGTTNYFDEGNGKQFTTDGTKEFAVSIRVLGTYSLTSNLTFRPMIKKVEDADPTFRPYVPTNAELLSYKDNGVLGAKNWFDTSDANVVSLSNVTKTPTDTGIRIQSTSAGTSRRINYYGTNLKKNTQYIFKSKVTITSGIAQVVIKDNTTSNYVLTSESGSLSGGENSIPFNTGDNEDLRISLYCTGSTSASGDVTYDDLMIYLATDTNPTHQPYAKTNRELTEVAQQVEGGYILVTKGDYTSVSVTADGVKTYQTLLNELYVALNTYIAAHPDEYLDIIAIRFNSNGLMYNRQNRASYVFRNAQFTSEMSFVNMAVASSNAYLRVAITDDVLANCLLTQWTSDAEIVDLSSEIPSSGFNIAFNFDIYHKIS